MTSLRYLADGEETAEPFAVWFIRGQCVRSGFPKLRGKGFAHREDGVDLVALEFAIDHTYFLGEALGALCPGLAARVLAADPSSRVALDASAGRMSLSDREVADLYAAPLNFATELLRTQPDPAWLPWWWLGSQGSTPPHTGRARMHVLLRRFFAVHVLYGIKNQTDFWGRAESYRLRSHEKSRTGAFAAWDPDGLTAWVEGAVEAFQRVNGRLPAVLGLD